jgi:RNA polymerase sigma factor (sigma-70 family)
MDAMSSGHLDTVMRRLRRLVGGLEAASLSDQQLLARFVLHKDEEAFAAIVQRHGRMVWGVCRRVLADANDADDAFQAAFLVLLNKAESLHARESLASWLQSVAWRLARRVKSNAARRKVKEATVLAEPALSHDSDPLWDDVRQVLDEELVRLPEKYRAPLILCYLEGKSYTEAATHLGCPGGTVSGRLARAREMLRLRLTRRGLALSTAMLTATLIEPFAAPAPAVAAVLRMASLFLIGKAAQGTTPLAVISLSHGLLRTWALSNLKLTVTIASVCCVVAVGAGWTVYRVKGELPGESLPVVALPSITGIVHEQEPPAGEPTRKDFYGDPLPPGAIARMGSVQFRHPDASFAFSADGKNLISVKDQTLLAWDVATGALLRRLLIPDVRKESYCPLLLARDGATVVITDNQCIRIYDTNSMRELRRFPVNGVNARALSGNGKILASSSGITKAGFEAIQTWDLVTGQKRASFENAVGMPGRIQLSHDGKILAAGSSQGLRLWDTDAEKMLGAISLGLFDWDISPDGKTVAASEEDGSVVLWESAGCTKLATLGALPELMRDCVKPVTFSSDGTLLAVSGIEKTIIWDVAARKELVRLPGRYRSSMLFAPDGKIAASVGGGLVRLWDMQTRKRLHPRAGYDEGSLSLAISPDGSLLASVGRWNNVVDLWRATNGQPLPSTPPQSLWVSRSLFAPNGNQLIWGGSGKQALLEARTGKLLREFSVNDVVTGKPGEEILQSHFSDDGKRLATWSRNRTEGSPTISQQLTIWDVGTGKELLRRPFACESLTGGFSPDGMTVSVVDHERLRTEETLTGMLRLNVPTDLGEPCAFSPTGHVAVFGIRQADSKGAQVPHSVYAKGLEVIELATGEEVCRMDCWALHTAFSQDGRIVVSVGTETIDVWDAVTGAGLLHISLPDDLISKNPGASITGLALMPDGHAAVTAMQNGTILVWDLTLAGRPSTWSRSRKMDRKDLEILWSDLIGDAAHAHPSVQILAAAPDQAIAFLGDRVQPAASVDAREIANLIGGLESKEFAVREIATRRLAQVGEQIEPELRKLLLGKPSPEVRKRIETILTGLNGSPNGETRRTLRVIQVLTMIGTPEARKVLEKIAGGAAEARETRQAKDALAN